MTRFELGILDDVRREWLRKAKERERLHPYDLVAGSVYSSCAEELGCVIESLSRLPENGGRDAEAMEALRRLNPRGRKWSMWFTSIRHDEIAELILRADPEHPHRPYEHGRLDPADAILAALDTVPTQRAIAADWDRFDPALGVPTTIESGSNPTDPSVTGG